MPSLEALDHPNTYQQYVAFERALQAHCLRSVRHADSVAFFNATFSLMSASEFLCFLKGMPRQRRDELLRAYALGFEAWLNERIAHERRMGAAWERFESLDEMQATINEMLGIGG